MIRSAVDNTTILAANLHLIGWECRLESSMPSPVRCVTGSENVLPVSVTSGERDLLTICLTTARIIRRLGRRLANEYIMDYWTITEKYNALKLVDGCFRA